MTPEYIFNFYMVFGQGQVVCVHKEKETPPPPPSELLITTIINHSIPEQKN